MIFMTNQLREMLLFQDIRTVWLALVESLITHGILN